MVKKFGGIMKSKFSRRDGVKLEKIRGGGVDCVNFGPTGGLWNSDKYFSCFVLKFHKEAVFLKPSMFFACSYLGETLCFFLTLSIRGTRSVDALVVYF